jgi:hypothetical protein
MARPHKTGLDYFSLDVNTDTKLELLEAKHGLVGFAVVIKLYQMIYQSGYYSMWSEEMMLLFKRRVDVEMDVLNEIINDCFKYSIFDKSLYERYGILTSSGIQKRYFTACERRKSINACKNFIIVDINLFNVNINWVDEYDNKDEEKIEKPQKQKQPFDLTSISDDFKPIIEDWLAYKKSRKETYKSQRSVIAFAEKLHKLSQGNPEQAKNICEQSIANNWAGIFQLKEHEDNRRINSETRKQRIAEEAARISGCNGD